MIISSGGGHNLPPEYWEVEYLESTGTQYIDLGFIPDANDSYDFRFKAKAFNLIDSGFANVSYGAQAKTNRFYVLSINNYHAAIGYGDNIATDREIDNGWHVYETVVRNGAQKLKIDNDIVVEANKAAYSIGFGNKNLQMPKFRNQNVERPERWSVAGFACDINGRPYLDFIPCYRKSDNKPGMYDLVSDTFFTNAGTGEFTVGPEVN